MAAKASDARPNGRAVSIKAASVKSTRDALPIPESLPLDGFSRWNDVEPFIPFCRETARKRELEGRFPRRHHLSQRCAAWSNRELHRWFADPINYRAEEMQ